MRRSGPGLIWTPCILRMMYPLHSFSTFHYFLFKFIRVPGSNIFIPSLIAGTLAAIGCWCHVVAVFYARISLDNKIESLTTPTPAAKKIQRWLSAPNN